MKKALFIPYMGRRVFREFTMYWAVFFYIVVGIALARSYYGPRASARTLLFYGLLYVTVVLILLLLTGRLMRYIGRRLGAPETPPE